MDLEILISLTLASPHEIAPVLLKWKKRICSLVWLKALEIIHLGWNKLDNYLYE